MRKINLSLVFVLFLTSCGGLNDAGKVLRNEKVKSTDEFLVKKRAPLVLPPDYDKIPKPGSKEQIQSNEQENIKSILKAPRVENNDNASSSTEESLLEKIRK